MNYKDYFKRLLKEGEGIKTYLNTGKFDPEQLKLGIKTEKEHTKDTGVAAKIAIDHLKEDPHYYTKLTKAGLEEGGDYPMLGGALAVKHDGRPIHLSKIIQVGALGASEPATGELSGFTAVKSGVTKDAGGVQVQGDKEPITAGGNKTDDQMTAKSVGGPIVPGEGQKQGGPNSQGTIANTVPMNESKRVIRKMVKEALKEITFDSKVGKWVRINETVDMKMGPAYKVSAPQYRTVDDDQARKVQYEPEITEEYDEEEECMMETRLEELMNLKRTLTEDELSELNSLNEKLENSRNFGLSPGGVEPNLYQEDSYKVVSPTQARTSNCDHARTVQTDPEVTEDSDFADPDNVTLPDDDVFGGDEDMYAGDAGECPECGNVKGNTAMGKTAQCARCGEDYYIQHDTSPEALHVADTDLSTTDADRLEKLGADIELDRPEDVLPDEDDTADIDEAGGGAVQHSSIRTVKDGNLPQDSKTRWRNDVDEGTKPKPSKTAAQIKKPFKKKERRTKYTPPRLSKSGVHKKKP